MEKLTFTSDDGEQQEYYIIAGAESDGVEYLLVSEENEEDAEALILKYITEKNSDGEEEAVYEMVTDEYEIEKVIPAFESVLGDISIEK
ncbi:Protein of unknown function [Lachnospiraceae bacterium]|nr:Protein of unknown function [Lachnospiraceae bacterium]